VGLGLITLGITEERYIDKKASVPLPPAGRLTPLWGLGRDKKIWGIRERVQFSWGAWQMQLCRVGVNFGASGFVRFLGSLSFHLRGSGSGGENCSIMPWPRSGRMQYD